jgi:hypothetical protein
MLSTVRIEPMFEHARKASPNAVDHRICLDLKTVSDAKLTDIHDETRRACEAELS